MVKIEYIYIYFPILKFIHLLMKPHKIYLSLSFLIILITVIWISSCTHKADLTGLPEVCFERDVLPIYTNSCAISGCHDGKGEAGPALNNYTNIVNTVVPGDPGASSSYQAMITKWGENMMPPGQPISLDNRTMVRVWIEQGALNNKCLTAKTAKDGLSAEQKKVQIK
jgi:hypothetical protein